MKLALIPYGQVSQLIPSLLPFLEESQAWARGRANVDDMVRFILTGQMMLWAFFDEEKVYGHMITEVYPYPRMQMLVVQYLASEVGTMAEAEDLTHETLARFAKDAGCAGIEFVGRPGWGKTAKAHGYEVQSVKYQKFFEVPG